MHSEPAVPRRALAVPRQEKATGVRIARVIGGALLLAAVIPAIPAVAQKSASEEIIYRREVYQYQRGIRPDPFRSLLGSVDIGVRLEDLALRGIVHHSNPRESVAILVESGTNRRIRARIGERVGAITVVAIHPRRVDVVIEDLGVPRRESLYLKVATDTGSPS
jgi:hypothetical protein